MGILSRYKKEKQKAEKFYEKIIEIKCPYFTSPVTFNAKGFHHLQFSNGSERKKESQLLKFNLLYFATGVIEKAGTVQEYRKIWGNPEDRKSGGKFETLKEIEYWGFVAIVKRDTNKMMKIKVILRRVGDGKIIFWSVMPVGNNLKDTYHLATGDLSGD